MPTSRSVTIILSGIAFALAFFVTFTLYTGHKRLLSHTLRDKLHIVRQGLVSSSEEGASIFPGEHSEQDEEAFSGRSVSRTKRPSPVGRSAVEEAFSGGLRPAAHDVSPLAHDVSIDAQLQQAKTWVVTNGHEDHHDRRGAGSSRTTERERTKGGQEDQLDQDPHVVARTSTSAFYPLTKRFPKSPAQRADELHDQAASQGAWTTAPGEAGGQADDASFDDEKGGEAPAQRQERNDHVEEHHRQKGAPSSRSPSSPAPSSPEGAPPEAKQPPETKEQSSEGAPPGTKAQTVVPNDKSSFERQNGRERVETHGERVNRLDKARKGSLAAELAAASLAKHNLMKEQGEEDVAPDKAPHSENENGGGQENHDAPDEQSAPAHLLAEHVSRSPGFKDTLPVNLPVSFGKENPKRKRENCGSWVGKGLQCFIEWDEWMMVGETDKEDGRVIRRGGAIVSPSGTSG